MSIHHTRFAFCQTNWSYLSQLEKDNAFRNCTEHLNCVIGYYAPEKMVNIKSKYVILMKYSRTTKRCIDNVSAIVGKKLCDMTTFSVRCTRV